MVDFLNTGKSSVKSHRNLILQSIYKQSPQKINKEGKPFAYNIIYISKKKASCKGLRKHLTE